MGSATLFAETRKSIDNKKFKFEAWSFLEELAHPEDSTAAICVKEVGSPETSPYWSLSVGLDEFGDKWMERWVEAFCSQPAYRKQFETSENGDGGVEISREWVDPETGEIFRQSTLPSIPNPPVELASKIISHAVAKIVKLGGKAKFRDFADLKSGRDAFSSVKLPALYGLLGVNAQAVMALDLDDENRSKVGRWVMRGLPLDMALHKVKVDLEISENVQRPRR